MVKDAYLVQQANIYVTQVGQRLAYLAPRIDVNQQMVRYMVLQYRDELVTIQRKELANQSRNGEIWSRPPHRQSSKRGHEWRSLFSDEEKDEVASDLLMILSKIPIQVIGNTSLHY